jgi:hypothetical protein
MRLKIIALFSLIVLVVGGLSYFLSRAAMHPLTQTDPASAQRAVGAAVAQLEVEGLSAERWLAGRAPDPALREPFAAGTEKARSETATSACNKVSEAAASAQELQGIRPALVLLVDDKGKVLGRDGSSMMRGDDLAAAYPSLKAALEGGTSLSDVWVNKARNEQLLASFAPIRGADGKILGALVFGSSLNDERLNAASDKTSGFPLAFAVKNDKSLQVVAKSSSVDDLVGDALVKGAAETALQALETGKPRDLSGLPEGYGGIARALEGYGDGKRAVVVAITKPAANSVAMALIWPAAGAILLGILLVAIAGYMLAAYIDKPIAEIEDGLLAIMNGQTNRRLDLEHEEFGGIVFRINSLLNQLFGVAEDDTDEQGRPSRAPTGREFTEALSVDESTVMGGGDPAVAQVLHAEEAGAYYARVFAEYVAAKRSIGDPSDHITQNEFVARLQASEQELAQKHGKPVRFKVEPKGKEVVLVAVPLVS